jgi:hypothetical protein
MIKLPLLTFSLAVIFNLSSTAQDTLKIEGFYLPHDSIFLFPYSDSSQYVPMEQLNGYGGKPLSNSQKFDIGKSTCYYTYSLSNSDLIKIKKNYQSKLHNYTLLFGVSYYDFYTVAYAFHGFGNELDELKSEQGRFQLQLPGLLVKNEWGWIYLEKDKKHLNSNPFFFPLKMDQIGAVLQLDNHFNLIFGYFDLHDYQHFAIIEEYDGSTYYVSKADMNWYAFLNKLMNAQSLILATSVVNEIGRLDIEAMPFDRYKEFLDQ